MSFLKRSVLALRALISILLASLVVFVLSIALWTYDTAGLQALLQGLVRVGAITRLTLSDGRTRSLEALMRWRNAQRPGSATSSVIRWPRPADSSSRESATGCCANSRQQPRSGRTAGVNWG
jgi:hypothetical protein